MATSLTSMRLSYFSLVLYTFGFAYYVLLAVAGIVLTWYRRRYAARTMLMTYSICLLLVNMSYGVLRLVVQERQLVERVKATDSCSPLTVAMQALAVLNILCNDTLFIHRAFILMQRRVTVLLFPAMLYAILFGTGALISLSCSSSPTQLPFNIKIHYDTLFATFLTTSCVLNATLTAIIARRLLLQPSSKFDYSRAGRIVIVVVESALLWTIAGFTFLVFTIARSDMSDALNALFDLAGEISPAMLIFRLAWHARDAGHSELRGSLAKKGSEVTLSESGSNAV